MEATLIISNISYTLMKNKRLVLGVLSLQQEMWVRKGFLQWWRDWAPHKWMPVEVELEQVLGHEGRKEALLLIYYRMGSTPKV